VAMSHKRKNPMQPIKTSIIVVIAFLTGASFAGPAAAQDASSTNWRNGPFPLECAKRDLQLINQLEQYGESRDMRPEVANEAFWTMMRARQACYDKQVPEGLALYDTIQTRTLAQRAQ
jgi:hypothetical protein